VPGGGSAGFTVLETLTAITILAIVLVALFEAQAQGLRTASAADDYAQARILAQGLLAETMSGGNGALASKTGKAGRFSWSVEVAQAREPWATLKSGSWRLNRIRVSVTSDKGRQLELNSLKLGRTDG
jgi:general secretion pathway protein I